MVTLFNCWEPLNFQLCKVSSPELINSFKAFFKDLNWLNPFIISLWDTSWALKQPTSWKQLTHLDRAFIWKDGYRKPGLWIDVSVWPKKICWKTKGSLFPFRRHFHSFIIWLNSFQVFTNYLVSQINVLLPWREKVHRKQRFMQVQIQILEP